VIRRLLGPHEITEQTQVHAMVVVVDEMQQRFGFAPIEKRVLAMNWYSVRPPGLFANGTCRR